MRLAWHMLTSTSPRLLWKFVWNFGFQGLVAVRRFHKRIRKGRQFPPFLFLSITSRCNLSCQGCWVTTTPPTPPTPPTLPATPATPGAPAAPGGPGAQLDVPTVERIIEQSSRQGSRFFGIMGGEPLLHEGLFDIFERHPKCYFQLFTNGTLLTDQVARRLRKAGNVTPLVSIEGDEVVSDQRRGGRNVYSRSLEGVRHCLDNRLITGVATSVCKSNIADLASRTFLDKLIDLGLHYVWYYSYRPSGTKPCPELALSPEELVRLREFIVEMRCRKPIIIVDTYYNERGEALCPAAEGLSCHVNPWGDIEPCPPIQFARENVADGDDIVRLIENSTFLRQFREFAAGRTRGCVLLEKPGQLQEFMRRQGARDSTGRGTGFEELQHLPPQASQHLPGREIPEKHWAYRFAKKHCFFGFGGYA